MQTIILYRYTRPDGGITTSPAKPDIEDYTLKYRLIADEGKALTNGTITTACIDVESPNGWEEIDAPNDITQEGDISAEEALNIIVRGEVI